MRARHLQLLAGITLAGALLRFTTLHVQSYWLDEVATVELLRKGFGGMISGVASGESTPPLYYAVAWVWAKLFGTGEFGLRSLSAVFGTATIPLAFALARRAAGERAAVIAAALAAFNPLLVWYSQEARSYALMILLTGFTLLVFLQLLDAPTRRRWVTWVVLAIASLATHYYAGFLIGAEALWLLWRAPVRRDAVASVGVVAVAAAALLPLALHQRSTGAAAFISESSLLRRLAQVPKQFAVGYQGRAEVLTTVVVLALIAYALVGLVVRAEPRARSRGLLLAGVGAAAVAAAFVLAAIGPDYLIARNVIASWLPLGAAVAIGFAATRGGWIAAVVVCAIGVFLVVSVDTNERYQRDDWRGAAQFIGKPDEPRAVIVTPAAGVTPLGYYLARSQPTPAAGVDVKELVFVGLAQRVPGQAPAPPRPPTVGAENFTETRRQQAQTYTVVVEKSTVGAHIPPQIGASSLDGAPAKTLYQR